MCIRDSNNSKISSFLTIQEGCDKFCKFCVVPYTRGPEYSRSFHVILKEAKQLIENGSKEITLLGQNVNAYHYKEKNDGKISLQKYLSNSKNIQKLLQIEFLIFQKPTSHN